jgi:hypothetical protein
LCDRQRGPRTGQTLLSQSTNIEFADILTRAFHGTCSAWSYATCPHWLRPTPRLFEAFRERGILANGLLRQRRDACEHDK